MGCGRDTRPAMRRSDNRLQMTWRHSNDQPLHLAGGHLGGLVGHRVDVPVRLEWGPRAKQTKHIVDKRPEIRGQDRLVYLLRRGIFRRGGTNGSAHDPPWFFFCSAILRSRIARTYLMSLTGSRLPCSSSTGSASFFGGVSG